jgi:hypothetical protein
MIHPDDPDDVAVVTDDRVRVTAVLADEGRAVGEGDDVVAVLATLGRISKRGDVYLRTMLIHGARTVIAQLERKRVASNGWLHKLVARRNKNIAAVALAAKNARIAWAVLAHERSYQRDYGATHAAAA